MDNRVAALGLAAIGVAAVATQSQRSAGPAPAESSSAAAPQAPPQKEPPLPPSPRGADLVHAFFGAHWPAASAAAPDTFALGTAIATLPNPYGTRASSSTFSPSRWCRCSRCSARSFPSSGARSRLGPAAGECVCEAV